MTPFAATASAAVATGVRALDGFESIASWHVAHTDDVKASLRSVPGKFGKALRLDFDFGNVNGYATAHRNLPLTLPDNYEISFWVRGDAPVNTLQLKLIDASGDNVWWFNRPDFVFPREWRQIRIKKRQLAFAWGPARDKTLHHSASIEFVVSSGRDGGKGSVEFDQLTLRPLPLPTIPPPHPTVSASSALPGAPAANAMDDNPGTAWRSNPADGVDQHVDIDLHESREFGGIVLYWHPDEAATDYSIEFSDDDKTWRSVRRVRDGDGGEDDLLLTESQTRFVRLVLQRCQAKSCALDEIRIKDLAWGASANTFFTALAKSAPRGSYPRGFTQQSYWTVVGVDGGPSPALISEDGAIEPAKASFSVEPFLLDGDKLVSWADVTPKQSLLDGYLPMPHVEWNSGGLQLGIDAFAAGTPNHSQVLVRYRLSNSGNAAREITLLLAVRPFQVNPPAQFLNTSGGTSPIRDLAWNGHAVVVNGKPGVLPLTPPTQFSASSYDAGQIPRRLVREPWPAAKSVHDDFGFASGALVYKLSLPAHGNTEVGLRLPMTSTIKAPALDAMSAPAWIAGQMQTVANSWRKKLNRVALKLPPQAQRIGNTLRTALADILITRDGPALRPGTRSYARSWIRDGAMMADALLRLDAVGPVRDYVDWYASHQFADGKVPCCVDWRGADPVPENDSQGELIHVMAQLYRYTGDRAELQKNWPHAVAAVGYMDSLRASERGAANRTGPRRAFYGLMPASISHEGYSAKPMHSYWDDFWSLTGYDDAVDMANAQGKPDQAARIARSRERFRHDLFASIALAVKQRGIDFIPGCAELGDFDPTSTTIALSPAGQRASLPKILLHNTYTRYWNEFVARRDGRRPWKDYTPYEWRNVDAMLRLGWRDRAMQALDFFFDSGERPAGWNQWAEVVGRDPREIRFVGDMPHGWVASDFIRSVLDLFAYQRYADRALVLAAGVPAAWLENGGIAISGLATPYGHIGYSLEQRGDAVELKIAAGAHPPGGFVLAWPLQQPPGATTIDGAAAEWHAGQLHIPAASADVTIALRGVHAHHHPVQTRR
ncbi:MAG: discoidin domain-containing protein [Rudaea sp.]